MIPSPKLVIANWKSNLDWHSAKSWAEKFVSNKNQAHSYVVCPPFPLLGALQPWAGQDFVLGVQDLSPYESGAYTGAVSAGTLEGLRVEYALLGHSERRMYFGETNQTVAQKVELAFEHGITPVVCIDRDQAQAQAAALDGLTRAQRSSLIVAYEPMHAISTFGGQEDPIEVTIQAIQEIRNQLNPSAVLYGGSVGPKNAIAYLQSSEIDGLLVGAKSLDPVIFASL